jgi:uncharacterized pyridoxal phosphate-containing UPF0001 family protein
MDTAIEIIKWALLILLAGFIGQFGKSLSLRVIHYFQDKKKKKISPSAEVEQEVDRAGKVDSIDPDHKTEKKMLKAQIKLNKKREKLKR